MKKSLLIIIAMAVLSGELFATTLWDSMGMEIAQCQTKETNELVMIKYFQNVGDESVQIYANDYSIKAGLYGKPNTVIIRNDETKFHAKISRIFFKKSSFGYIKLDKKSLTGKFYIKSSSGDITKGKLIDCDFF